MLRKGQHIVVGNPGRLFDMISKRHLRTDDLKLLVMDEGDALLSENLKSTVYDIIKCLPPNIQVAFFSTSLAPEILDVTTRFMRNAVSILTPDHMLMPAQVRHFYMVGGQQKVNRVLGIWGLITRSPGAIIFCNSRRSVDDLAEGLAQAGLEPSFLHAELDQKERDLVMREFRNRSCKVLICTNEFGRGLNVPRVRLVVNCDMPSNAEDYLLRSGRCGRYGRGGVAVTLVTRQEIPTIHAIANHYHLQVKEAGMETVHESLGECKRKIHAQD
jgi:superfamily II DNA/RNA helicase